MAGCFVMMNNRLAQDGQRWYIDNKHKISQTQRVFDIIDTLRRNYSIGFVQSHRSIEHEYIIVCWPSL
ncbi:MAG: hypothetical protein D6737_03815 [Chloroflexi bacterium]|nr:MAG: hypothetical protein CUN54_04850 [Phototrophicales bacterium]RMF81808.1 MAG: hypothetical protein D6737_03815 [Chloroflexota bacterium]